MPCWQVACNSAQNEESQQARITRAQYVQLTAVQRSTKLSANCFKTQSRCHNAQHLCACSKGLCCVAHERAVRRRLCSTAACPAPERNARGVRRGASSSLLSATTA
eukprot:3882755-Pleurochrysis_carterae.AAC.1